MVKMSFSRSDSGQYSNVEPPGIEALEATFSATRGFWSLNGVQVTTELKMLARMRTYDRCSIAGQVYR